jgi:hypothetical protein
MKSIYTLVAVLTMAFYANAQKSSSQLSIHKKNISPQTKKADTPLSIGKADVIWGKFYFLGTLFIKQRVFLI